MDKTELLFRNTLPQIALLLQSQGSEGTPLLPGQKGRPMGLRDFAKLFSGKGGLM